MKRIKVFFGNALILASVTLIMRTVSVLWGAYISKRIGAEGMGLFSLIMSAYAFAVTLSTSGINLSVVRLVSEELARGNGGGAVSAMRRCLAYALIFGALSAVLLFSLSGAISENILGEARAGMSLKALSVSLPFIAISNVFSGYFTAVKRIYKSAVSNIVEQFLKIGIIFGALGALAPRGTEYACLALVIGTSVSEGLSFSYMLVLYLIDKRRHIKKTDVSASPHLTKRMLGISLPIAFSAYLRSGLSTAEHALIPRGLRQSGENASGALSLYGVIHGMVFPLVLFPAALCQTFASLIVPELSELCAKYKTVRESRHIKYIVSRAVKLGMLFSVFVAGIMATFSEELGYIVYENELCGRYIRIFSFLIPVMYLDTVVDGMLKGLGEQLASMRYNIIDAAVSVLLVILLLPRYGIYGYVFCVFATELLNATLSLARLIKVTGVRLDVLHGAALPLICAAGACALSNIAVRTTLSSPLPLALIGTALSAALYIVLSLIVGAVSKEERRWLGNIMK